MEERYNVACERGLLWYLGIPMPETVTRVPAEVSALLAQRNRLAAYLAKSHSDLPPLIREPWSCASCFQRTACAMMHKAREECKPQYDQSL